MTCVLQVILDTNSADTILLVGRNNISMKSGNIFQGLKTIQSRGIPYLCVLNSLVRKPRPVLQDQMDKYPGPNGAC